MIFSKSTPEKVQDAIDRQGAQVANGIENAVDAAHVAAHDALANVADKIDALQDQARPAVERLVARGEQLANNAIAGSRRAGERAKKAVSGYAGACESYVTEQPMKAVAIAAAAGAAIAALLILSSNRSRRHDRQQSR
jgi:ElaB/YqjD/DUF883 family membrane-anchored ribosome-binding protein